ncbi:hypothetical protein [Salinarimonas sp.]|uniref:hypothetical protein n=1 Tax=Salinarimonas sp. TaxID=2766526 RepID=UPI0032D963CF
MIVLDANAIVLLIAPGGAMRHIESGPRRVRRFLETVGSRGETVLLPSPALAEVIAGGSDRLALVREEVAVIELTGLPDDPQPELPL